MKFKEIKPGMVIHCPTEGNVRVLLEHLTEMGYEVSDAIKTNAYRTYKEKICFYINPTENVSYGDIDFYAHDEDFRENEGNLIITEFSDLIEPDDSPMSAVEVLEWLHNHYNDYDGEFFTRVFGADYTLSELLIEKKLSPREIVDSITAYEAAKKAPKPVEVEWVDVCRIIQIQDNGVKKCVYEEEIPKDTADCLGIAEEILKRYISDHDGEHIAVIEDICRVKEGK